MNEPMGYYAAADDVKIRGLAQNRVLKSGRARHGGGSANHSKKNGANKVMSRKTALAILLALSALYCLAELVPGRFAVTDEVFFKAAGRNWAATGRFAAPEMKGYFSNVLVPPATEVFFAYPPLYTFLFGVYTMIV